MKIYQGLLQKTGDRLDKVLSDEDIPFSRSKLKRLIEEGCVKINQETVRDPSQKITQALSYEICDFMPQEVQAQDIPLDILYEDEDVIVINKPAGLVVHPGAGNPDGTLVNGLLYHCGNQLGKTGDIQRPGIVHRIDKETSGLLVVAKNEASHACLSQQFATHSIHRVYHALVWGTPPASGVIEASIGRHFKDRQRMAVMVEHGKNAVTHYKVIKRFSNLAAHIECKLETGRTHQIRVHLSFLGFPVIGDPIYGKVPKHIKVSQLYSKISQMKNFGVRQFLHAKELGFLHPISNEWKHFSSPYPEDFDLLLSLLEGV